MMIEPRSHASPEEVAFAFASLGTADYGRIGRIAQLRARGLPEVDWRDLVQEATQRALDGSRRWPLDVPFVVFMAESIRSIASEAWRRRGRHSVAITNNDADDGAIGVLADEAPDPERTLVAQDLLSRLYALFAGDPAAKAIIQGLADGLDPHEIQARATLTATAYDSARRRIRRTIARANLEMV